jgi:hypothetical protein
MDWIALIVMFCWAEGISSSTSAQPICEGDETAASRDLNGGQSIIMQETGIGI